VEDVAHDMAHNAIRSIPTSDDLLISIKPEFLINSRINECPVLLLLQSHEIKILPIGLFWLESDSGMEDLCQALQAGNIIQAE